MILKSDTPTDTVIVSFRAKWTRILETKQLDVVFRLRVPTAPVETMFIYIGAPVSAIVGRASILKTEQVSHDIASELAHRGHMSRSALLNYIGNRKVVGVYYVKDVHFFNKQIPLSELRKQHTFHPPQSFSFVSHDAYSVFEAMGG